MPFKQITPPALEPVTVQEIKVNEKIDYADEDGLIESYLLAARQYVEAFLRQQLVTAEYCLTLDAFPAWEIAIPLPPLVSVDEIRYLDSQGVQQTFGLSDCRVDIASKPGRLTPAYGECWPSTRCETNAVEIDFTCGYGNPADVPQVARTAIMLLAGHWFKHRDSDAIPPAVQNLLGSVSHGFYLGC